MPLSLNDDECNAVQGGRRADPSPATRCFPPSAKAKELCGPFRHRPRVVHRRAAALQKTFVVAAQQRDVALRRAATRVRASKQAARVIGRNPESEHSTTGEAAIYRSSSVLAFSYRPALGP